MATSFNQTTPQNSGLSRSDSLKIRRAVAFVASAMKGKPEPQDFWYDCARNDDEAVTRNGHLDLLVVRCRQALEKAKTQGEGTQAATVHRVEVMFGLLCAMTILGYEGDADRSSLPTKIRSLSEEIADVVAAAARAAHDPSASNLEALRIETLEMLDVGEDVIDGATLQLAGAR